MAIGKYVFHVLLINVTSEQSFCGPTSHELYIYANALDMHTNFAPQLKGRYLTSNVNITVANKQGNPVSIPLGSKCIPTSFPRDPKNTRSDRFAKFKTRK